jgi:hypothetical protein
VYSSGYVVLRAYGFAPGWCVGFPLLRRTDEFAVLFHDVTSFFLLISFSVAKPDRVLENLIFCSLRFCWSYIVYNCIYGTYQVGFALFIGHEGP